MDVIENDGYYKLVLMYKGLADAEALLAKHSNNQARRAPLAFFMDWRIGITTTDGSRSRSNF